ncbi:MAG: bifunctional YncE family protein/alkaline phosphatase family protein [Bryobacterales bacterium]|nr:bifunctional YncE family protein/alkaline phosphatase family protein [Bryobacterales bacterium]
MKLTMRILVFVTCVSVAMGLYVTRRIGRQDDGSFVIPTGQVLTPAGTHVEVSDRPLGMVLSPDGKMLAVVTGSNFAPRSLHLVSMASKTVTQTIPIGDSFVGVAFDSDGRKLYVGGGKSDEVKVFARADGGEFRQSGAVKIAGGAPSGLALSADGRTLYVALNLKHAVAMIDTATLNVKEIAVGSFPYTVVVRGAKVYVSNWGGRRPTASDTTDGTFPVVLDPRTGIPASGTVSVIDSTEAKVIRHIEVGLHPSAMVVSPDGSRLYVANANSDSVSVVNTETETVVSTLNVRLFRSAPLGSSPNALALSRDGKRLYVANGANNAVAVVDPGDAAKPVRGFIPTGWYPTAVALSADGAQLCVASGYGFGSIAPLAAGRQGRSYRDRVGVVSLLDIPNPKQLAAFTAQVRLNNRAEQTPQRPAGRGHPIPMDAGRASPIRHVFYIIKENRTYDQVFGDMERGNGDPALVHFGRAVTPNHHALAETYVLLDNYYAPGDQSALGHRWCTQGYASDWLHKYGNGRSDANPMLYAPSDFLWDNAKAHQVSVRSYGERGEATITPRGATWSDIYKDWKSGAGRVGIEAKPTVLGLRDIYHPRYPGFNMRVTDQRRASEFLAEFAEFEKNGNLPRLVVLLLPQDHTNGTAPGYPTPRACVADNDLALGRIVEAISRSRYWKESAIFVTEDDAQDGVDHVDGHRTVGLVISPWTKRGTVDSTLYTTINMYRTIEQILGLPVSNQFDLAADPMFSVFTTTPDATVYRALPSRIPLDEMNPPLRALRGLPRTLAEMSMRMDFTEPDAADEGALNRAIWHSVKGPGARYPGPPEP